MLVHDTIRWGLRAEQIATSILPRFVSSSMKHRTIGDAILMLELPVLLEGLELNLKRRLERFLAQTRGPTWWATLPKDVRRKAELRWKWSSADLGARLPPFPDMVWLSMGDTLLVLSALSFREWKTCMDAERSRRKAFQQLLRSVKSFRDFHVAHPK